MSTRTIIEINHDYINLNAGAALLELLSALRGSEITGRLNRAEGDPVEWLSGIRVLAQRHHSETITLEVK